MSAVSQYFYDIFHSLLTVVIGMGITFKHLFTRSATVQYPTVKMKIPERGRNRLYVNIDDCIGCLQCSNACPVDCIGIETLKATPDVDLGMTSKNTKKRLYVMRFDIDFAKCCFCGLCTYPCPTECIQMTSTYEYSEYDRLNLIYNFSRMTPEECATAKEKLKQVEAEQAAKKAAVAPPVLKQEPPVPPAQS